MRQGLIPGYNVDVLDVASGLNELVKCGYRGTKTKTVIEYALNRWVRGEEECAERGAIDQNFHGISPTCWYRVLAAAMAGAQMPAVPLS